MGDVQEEGNEVKQVHDVPLVLEVEHAYLLELNHLDREQEQLSSHAHFDQSVLVDCSKSLVSIYLLFLYQSRSVRVVGCYHDDGNEVKEEEDHKETKHYLLGLLPLQVDDLLDDLELEEVKLVKSHFQVYQLRKGKTVHLLVRLQIFVLLLQFATQLDD